MKLRADLHIHSCLSPCGSLEMSPTAIVERAVAAGLGLIALTDHNSAMNCPAVERICAARGDIRSFYGMEVTSVEEVHLLALFDTAAAALDFGEFIYSHLPDIMNDPEKFGDQVYVDEDENILGEVDKFLGNAVDLSIDGIEAETHSRGGIFIPSHIDRELYSMVSQLGFLPDGKYDAVELSRHFFRRSSDISAVNPQGYPVITSSDAHYPDGIGSAGVIVEADDISVKSVASALLDRRVSPFFETLLTVRMV